MVKKSLEKKSFYIGSRECGQGLPPAIIAEVGINHGGSLEEAKLIVDAAANAGAEIIKHQTHVISDEMSVAAKTVIPGNTSESIYEVMERCALSYKDEIELKKYVEEKGLIFISTPFSREAANRLNDMGVSCFKIGSGECNNLPLIRHIASFGKPIILSTGMNDLQSVKNTVSVLREYDVPFSLLHTTNLYPTPSELVRLGGMQELMAEFPDIQVGLSDHTTENLACFAAVALGATILERHFTDTKDREGPDIVNSMDPYELEQLSRGTKEIVKMLGGKKEAASQEKVTINFAFATVVATKKISKGEVFTEHNLWVKRPGTGDYLAGQLTELYGKIAAEDINADQHIMKVQVFD